MADPLSVAGLATGVVSLGLQVAGGITDYIDALNCRSQDILLVKQQNESLQRTLQVVETSLSQFQRDHQVATVAARECLDLCKQELKALQSLVVDITACDQPTADRKSKIKNKGKRLLYPFSRPKLEQLETRLRNTNATLQLALQSLGLSVSQLGTEKLATLEATSHDISSNFRVVRSEISSMSIPLQSIHSTLSGFETRFDGFENLLKQLLLQQSAVGKNQPEIIPVSATSQLRAKRRMLRNTRDSARDRAKPTSSEMVLAANHHATHFNDADLIYVERTSCLCRHRRRLQRKYFIWGPLQLSFETITEEHLPGCPASQQIACKDRSKRIGLTYTGLQNLISSAVQLSFSMTSVAEAWSLNTTFAYYPTVDSETSPAFRILSLLIDCRGGRYLDNMLWSEMFVPAAVSAVLRLLRAKKTSPRAVDAQNRSLVSWLAKCFAMDAVSHLHRSRTPITELFHPICSVVANSVLTTAAQFILKSSAETRLVSLSDYITGYFNILHPSGYYCVSGPGIVPELQFLASSLSIAEAYGCGPLSLAILSNNIQEVEHLVRNHPSTLAERNLLGHSPLHLAVDKPKFLRVLVQAADTTILNQASFGPNCRSILEAALVVSGELRCLEGHSSRRCRRCSCAESVVILLKADCALPVSETLQQSLNRASQRCKLKYIRHVKDRRDRLRQLALENLPPTEVDRLGLAPGHVLDSFAPQVVQLLQDHYHVQIPAALTVLEMEPRDQGSPLSIYQALADRRDAELFFRSGFHDTDSWCRYDVVGLDGFNNRFNSRSFLLYLHWLMKHGSMSHQLKSFKSGNRIFATNYLFLILGQNLGPSIYNRCFFYDSSIELPLDERRAWIHELNTSVLKTNNADACRCKCSPKGCTALTSLLKGMSAYYRDSDEISRHFVDPLVNYLTFSCDDLDAGDHIVMLQYMTYTALGIPHSCCQLYRTHAHQNFYGKFEEIQDEYAYDLALLEELVNELESELVAILRNPEQGLVDLISFWERTWAGRVGEILDRLEGNDLTDDERRGAEEIGVVWDKMGPEPPPEVEEDWRKLDYWMAKLEKIEAEC
ncbi:hypothetical protein F4803DRAFT_197268 [Xylaria telfairii]|nr:hypothetical protein F4803DRAFT_197268 [Xylaria telfairii]